MKKIIIVFIICGFLLALFFRFYLLGSVPTSLDWDEASIGYNAFSIIHTGRDEYGTLLPFVFRSFNDYKPGMYVYLVIPSIQLLGINEFAVRLPSALMGVLAVVGTFFLVRELISHGKFKENDSIYKHCLPILSSLLLALSPWHIQFSRVAFEANSALTASIFGVFFFLAGRKKPIFFCFSAICFSATFYFYQSAKVFTPLFVLLLIVIYNSDIRVIARKYILLACIVFLVLISPLLIYTVKNPQALSRISAVNPLHQEAPAIKKSILRVDQSRTENDIFGQIVNNRRLVLLKTYIDNYLSHFSLNWLFINGDGIGRHQPPFFGHLYLWELPFLLLGIYYFIWGSFDKKTKLLILGWILLAPLPAAPTNDVPHAVRTLTFLPVPQILIAVGLLGVYIALRTWGEKHKIITCILSCIVFVIILLNISYYANQYFVQQHYYDAKYWQYGFKETINYITKEKGSKKVVFSEPAANEQAYIFYLFYSEYDPNKYIASGGSNKNFQQCFSIENVFFGVCQDKLVNGDLYVAYGALDGSQNLHELKHITLPNKDEALSIYEYRK